MQSTTSDIVRLRHCQIVSGSCQEVCKDARFFEAKGYARGQTASRASAVTLQGSQTILRMRVT